LPRHKFLGWLVKKKKIIPHIPVWEKSDRQDGIFSHSDFHWDRKRRICQIARRTKACVEMRFAHLKTHQASSECGFGDFPTQATSFISPPLSRTLKHSRSEVDHIEIPSVATAAQLHRKTPHYAKTGIFRQHRSPADEAVPPMTKHMSGTREEWLAVRLGLLKEEKELTRRTDELVGRRQELLWVQVDKEYRFEADEGSASQQAKNHRHG